MTSSGEQVLDAVLSIRRHSVWTLDSLTPLEGDVGHPQGLTVHDGNWWVSTVHPSSSRGVVCVFDPTGQRIREFDVTDDERIHPGGIDHRVGDDSVWVSVAEYRPHSTTSVLELDMHRSTLRFSIEDHLGAICNLGDGTLLAVSWGSREFYRIDYDGNVLERRDNPSHMVDFQDLQVVAPGFVLASGVSTLPFGNEMHQLGGLAIVESDNLHIVHEVPISATMPSGRAVSYNGFHVGWGDDRLSVDCLVDDSVASIGHWTVS